MTIASCLLACAILLPTPLLAVTWTVHDAYLTVDVTTDTGLSLQSRATLTGSFEYDATTNTYSKADLLITGVPGTSPFGDAYSGRYQTVGPSYPFALHAVRSSTPADRAAYAFVMMSFDPTRTVTEIGGEVPLSHASVGYCTNADCTFGKFVAGTSSGHVSAPFTGSVPLPASLPLLIAALAGLLVWRRRRA